LSMSMSTETPEPTNVSVNCPLDETDPTGSISAAAPSVESATSSTPIPSEETKSMRDSKSTLRYVSIPGYEYWLLSSCLREIGKSHPETISRRCKLGDDLRNQGDSPRKVLPPRNLSAISRTKVQRNFPFQNVIDGKSYINLFEKSPPYDDYFSVLKALALEGGKDIEKTKAKTKAKLRLPPDKLSSVPMQLHHSALCRPYPSLPSVPPQWSSSLRSLMFPHTFTPIQFIRLHVKPLPLELRINLSLNQRHSPVPLKPPLFDMPSSTLNQALPRQLRKSSIIQLTSTTFASTFDLSSCQTVLPFVLSSSRMLSVKPIPRHSKRWKRSKKKSLFFGFPRQKKPPPSRIKLNFDYASRYEPLRRKMSRLQRVSTSLPPYSAFSSEHQHLHC
jgi:hypothetical protein